MSPQQLLTRHADVSIDLRAEARVGRAVDFERRVGRAAPGDVVEVISEDPGAGTKLCRWAESRGYRYLGTAEEPGFSRVYLRRIR